jgi:hypothetical protein
MSVQIKVRRGDFSDLTANPLASYEIGYTEDTKQLWIGKGGSTRAHLIGQVEEGSVLPGDSREQGVFFYSTGESQLYYHNGSGINDWVKVGLDDLDQISDGSTYGRVKLSELEDGQVAQVRAVNASVDVTGDTIQSHLVDLSIHRELDDTVAFNDPEGNVTLWSANKIQTQIDSKVSGVTWKAPVVSINMIGHKTAADLDEISASAGDAYMVTAGGSIGSLSTVIGDIVEYDGSAWIKLVQGAGGLVPAGTRVVVTNGTAIAPFEGEEDKIFYYNGSSNTPIETDPQEASDGNALLVNDGKIAGLSGVNANNAYVYEGAPSDGEWVLFAGPQSIIAGVGLEKTGNTLSVRLGYGLDQVPTGEVGIVADNESIFVNTDLDRIEVKGEGIEKKHLNANVAGAGLGVDTTNGVFVKPGSGIDTSGDVVSVNIATGLSFNGSGEVQIDNSVAGSGLSINAVSKEMSVNLGTALAFAGDDINVAIDGTTISTNASNQLELADGGITAGKIDTGVAGVGLVHNGTQIDVNYGDGLTAVGDVLNVDAGQAVSVSGGQVDVQVDDTTVRVNGSNQLEVKNAGITSAKLNTDVAGEGLVGGNGAALDVNVDDSTIEISADTVQVKDAGITSAKLNAAVAGPGIVGGAGSALAINTDNSTLEVSGDVLQVKADGITSNELDLTDTYDLSGGDVLVSSSPASNDSAVNQYYVDNAISGASLTAGSAIDTSGQEISVKVDDTTIEISGDQLRVVDRGITGAKLATEIAGNGLTFDEGNNKIDVAAGDGIVVSNDKVSVVAGNGITIDTLLFNDVQVVASTGISVGAGGVAVDYSSGIDVNGSNQIIAKVDGTSIQFNGSGELEVVSQQLGSDLDGQGLEYNALSERLDVVAGSGIAVYDDAVNIDTAGVTEDHLNASVAGAGLIGGAGSALAINTDNSTLEVAGDVLQVKADGITSNELDLTDTYDLSGGDVLVSSSPASNDSAVNQYYVDNAVADATLTAGSAIDTSGQEISVKVDDTTIEISGDQLQVKDAGITSAKLDAAVAGAGLVGGAGSALAINTDNSTLEVAGDVLQVKADGITSNELDLTDTYDLSGGDVLVSSSPASNDSAVNQYYVDNAISGASLTAGSAIDTSGQEISVKVDDTTIEISGDQLQVKDAGVTSAKLNAGVAGAGLVGGAGSALAINTDNSTLEIAGDVLQVKADGIGSNELALNENYDLTGTVTVNTVPTQDAQVAAKVYVDNAVADATLTAGAAIDTASQQISVKVDDSSIEISGDQLQVKAEGITSTEINADIAGAGLVGGAGSALAINTDNSTLEVAGDVLQVKADGITSNELDLTDTYDLSGGDVLVSSSPASNDSAVNQYYVDNAVADATLTAGSAIDTSGQEISVKVDDSSIEISGDQLQVKAEGITATELSSAVAGSGLSGGAGSALSVNVATGIEILGDSLAVDYSSGIDVNGSNQIIAKVDGTSIQFNGSGELEVVSQQLGSDLDGFGLEYNTLSGRLDVRADESTLTVDSTVNDWIQVKDAGITSVQLNTDVAGPGLSGGNGSALEVNVDDSTIEISSDTLQVKAAGITSTELNTDVAGDALAGGAGSALDVQVDDSSIEVNGSNQLQVKAEGVTATELSSAVAGPGLSGGNGSALEVNVDDSTIEISSDTLQVKAGGITGVELNSSLAGEGVSLNGGTNALDVNVDNVTIQITTDVLEVFAVDGGSW